MLQLLRQFTPAARRPRRIVLNFFEFKSKVEPSTKQATNMTTGLSEPLCFNSRSKAPYDKFSNFYEVKIEMSEGCFNSVEHYFQSMKFIDKNHPRFEVEGDLGRQSITTGNWKPTVAKGRFIKSAGSKSGTAKYGLLLRSDGLDRARAKKKMKEGLRKKFQREPFKSFLLETRERPLVHTPLRGKTDYWTARVDKVTGEINGNNNMGKLLMEVRQELQEESDHSPLQIHDKEVKDKTVSSEKEHETSGGAMNAPNEGNVSQRKDTKELQGSKRKHDDIGEEMMDKNKKETDKQTECKEPNTKKMKLSE